MKTNDDSTLTVSRVIDAKPEEIFEALTNSAIMQKWFFASADAGWSASVKNDATEGGHYQIDMHSPKETYSHEGEYKTIIPNKKIVFTWNSQAVRDTIVTISLREVTEGAEIILVHEFMPNEEMKQNHEQGWTQILANLDAIVTS